ncbi:MAG: DUF58 domain-containing protein [Pirellulales bacterium]
MSAASQSAASAKSSDPLRRGPGAAPGVGRAMIHPAALMQIKNLSLRAKSVVEGFSSGMHRSPLHGFSVEFSEYRPYVLGDDPRRVDWKLLARTDRYYVKQYEDETNRRCYIVVDQSRSMAYGSLAYSKAEYGRTLAATFAYFLTQQRDAVGLMTCGEGEPDFIPARHRPGHFQQLMRHLEKESLGQMSTLAEGLSALAARSRRRGLVIIISDLLLDPESLALPLGYLRGRGHEVILIRTLDPREVNFTLDHSTMLRDMETGRQIYVDPAAAKQTYDAKFAEHRSQLTDLCHRRNARIETVPTDSPLEAALFELITQMMPK